MQIYILKHDLPWAKAGSEWVITEKFSSGNLDLERMNDEPQYMGWSVDWSFEAWFEEKQVCTCSKEFAKRLKKRLQEMADIGEKDVVIWRKWLICWIDQHTL